MTLPAQDIVELVESIRWSKFGDAKWPRRVLTGPEEFERIASTIESLTADNEALRKERDEARAAHHRTSHKAVKRLRALWREKQAAESRADALAQEVERLRTAITDIADSDDVDNALDPARNKRVARVALGDRP